MFPITIGSPYDPGKQTGARVQAAIAADPERAAKYARRFGRDVEGLPFVLEFSMPLLPI